MSLENHVILTDLHKSKSIPKDHMEFNEKYKDFIEEDFYGLAINNKEVIAYLDELFSHLTKIPGFQYAQIKTKFQSVRFYSNLSHALNHNIEKELQEILKMKIVKGATNGLEESKDT